MKKSFLAIVTTAVLLSLTSCDLSISRPASSISSPTSVISETSGVPTTAPTSVDPTSVSPTSESSETPTTTSDSTTATPTSESSSSTPTTTATPTSTTVTPTPISVTSVSLNKNTLDLNPYKSETLVATVLPENATNKSVSWSTSNSSVAIVTSSGRVTAIKVGTAVITVRSVDGSKTDTCNVNVSETIVPVTGVNISKTSLSLNVNNTSTLTATILPSDATNKNVTWSSSDESVATVTNGLVTAINPGTAQIKVKTEDGNYEAKCDLTVTAPVTGVAISPKSTSLMVGNSQALTYTISPSNATNKNVTWSSSNNSVATVDSNGVVKAVAQGSATITVRTSDGGKTDTCNVTVSKLVIPVSGISVTPTTAQISVGETKALSHTIEPDNATDKSVTYVSNNSSVASVDSDGVITGKAGGTAIITATASSGVKATCTVTVTTIAVSGVTISPSTGSVSIGSTLNLTANVSPSNATNKSVTWSSSATSVATVDSNGVVTGIAAGTATITVKTVDGNKTATCTVTVKSIAVSGVSVSPKTSTINVGQTATLSATVSPGDATNKSVTWSSSATSVATVDSNGVVKGIAVGSATITAKTVDGNKTDTATVTVQKAVEPVGETYSITFVKNGSDSSTDLTSSTYIDQVETGKDYIESWNSTKAYAGINGIKLSSSKASGSMTIGLSSTVSSNKAYKVAYEVIKYSSTTPETSLSINGSEVASFSNDGECLYTLPSSDYVSSITISANARVYIASITIDCMPDVPVDPTGISLPEEAGVGVNSTVTLNVTYSPKNCNQNKGVTWKSSNTSVATVNNGVVTGVSVGTATITATSTFNQSFTATCKVTVTEVQADKWTILIYMCGADLESDGGQASADILEILDTANQPDDVNIVIETGGSKYWELSKDYISGKTGIPNDSLNRWHVQNNKLVFDSSVSNASMGKSGTYQSFLEYGLKNYPAEKTGVILWNHGGGLDGVCFDENYSDDALTNSEMKTAYTNAFKTAGITGTKLEFIGYDACLMQGMEIADYNSSFFKYQVASQESENGSGWYYTGFIDDVYANNPTTTILKEVCDEFIRTQGKSSDQTLSYLDLSKASAFKTAWESYASALSSKMKSTSTKGSTFCSYVTKNVRNYSEQGYCGYGQFDIKDLMNKVATQSYAPDSLYKTAVESALSSYIAYNKIGSGAGNSNGLSCVYVCSRYVEYSSDETSFTNWLSFNNNYHY